MAVVLFVGVAFIFLYKQKGSDANIIKAPPKEYAPDTSKYAKDYAQFVMDLPCGVTDFDSPHVKPVQCDPEKTKKGEIVTMKFKGRIADEQGNGVEKVRMTVNNGELFYTDKLGFF
ncbi:MAG: hypothetical protein U9Q12_03120 [Patescibacteria group bacterium]|nr:hypothetical protein [Patescibacteria group bacterium]